MAYRHLLFPLGVFLAIAGATRAAELDSSKARLQFFEQRIRPVLVKHCYECHSEQAKIVAANLLLDSREGMLRGGDTGPALVAGDAKKSLLIAALRQDGLEMPPQGKLPDAVIDDFVKWIDSGATDPRDGKPPEVKGIDLEQGRQFWSFQPPQLVPPPPLVNQSWPRTQIDRYVLANLEASHLLPAPDAPRDVLLRRMTFDLTGLPPTPEELQAFVSDDTAEAVAKVVDRLLASSRYGERWGRYWLDVARYAESSGKERNVPYRMAWRYRNYVIDAFNADLPYDQFIREQLAGDLLPHSSAAERDRKIIATGFLTIGPKALTERVEEQYLLDVADEQLDTVCRALLASTAACARCHDHKFDPIPTTDYYALIGIFRSTENLAGVRPLRREFIYGELAALGDEATRDGRCRELQEQIAVLQKQVDQCRSEMRVAVKNKDASAQQEIKLREADAQKQLTAAWSLAENDEAGGARFAMAVRDRAKVADYAVRIRGEVNDLGETVPRGFLSVLANEHTPPIPTSHSGRLELADWIASRHNPLTARVLVNRLWQRLFGQGLVVTTDNFGVMGEKPSHPELLDYLAIRFVEDGWSIKRMLREMMLSRTYQMSGERDQAAYARDPTNRLLWRFGRRRLEAEAIRDAILSVSGQLDDRRPANSATLKLNNLELGSSARTLAADDSFRWRSVYLPMLRGNVPEMLALFDMADPSLTITQREVTTVATQALYLMNSKFVMEQSQRFAERLLTAHPDDDAARIELAYRLALARDPSAEELQQIRRFLAAAQADAKIASSARSDAWAGVCQSLLGSAEFLYIR